MTLMYTFSRRAGLIRRIMRVEGLRGALPVWSCCAAANPTLPPHGTAANPLLLPSWRRYQPDAAPSRCRRQPGAAILHGAAGRGRAINRYVTFLYRGF